MVNFTNGAQYIYVLREGYQTDDKTGYYKIGKSVRPEKRLRNLQTGNPRRLHFHCDPNYWQVNDRQVFAAERAAFNAVNGNGDFKRVTFPDRRHKNTEWFYSPTKSCPCGIVQNAIRDYLYVPSIRRKRPREPPEIMPRKRIARPE